MEVQRLIWPSEKLVVEALVLLKAPAGCLWLGGASLGYQYVRQTPSQQHRFCAVLGSEEVGNNEREQLLPLLHVEKIFNYFS